MKSLFALLLATTCFAQMQYAGKGMMNGITYSEYPDFDKKWKLVTVRFRKDTSEMRFVYANDLAYKALSDGKLEYPDGAVFAKIGLRTQSDPLFESSAVPGGTTRQQFMVRDKVKYKDTGGWGYALFDFKGQTVPEEPSAEIQACYACHRIADSRGGVFSLIADLHASPFQPMPKVVSPLAFAPIELPADVRAKLPAQFATVLAIQGPISQFTFSGTLDEIVPALIKQASATHAPAALFVDSGKTFVIVWPTIDKAKCGESSAYTLYRREPSTKEMHRGEFQTTVCGH